MGQWGDGPFECDGGLDEAFALLDHLVGKVEQVARATGGDRSCIFHDGEELAANVALLGLVAEAVYRPAMFVPLRGMPLPAPEVIDGWRGEFLARCIRLAAEQLEGTPAELERFAKDTAAPLSRLADLSRRQSEASDATHREVVTAVVASRPREANEASSADAGKPDGEREP
jgi:hypothetical protein